MWLTPVVNRSVKHLLHCRLLTYLSEHVSEHFRRTTVLAESDTTSRSEIARMSNTLLRPTRRTLVRGAAWSVPVVSIAATAPAFAASPCRARSESYRLDWGQPSTVWAVSKPTVDGVHTGTATISGPTNATPVVVTFVSTMFRSNGDSRRAADNLTVSADTDIGDLGAEERGLNVAHDVGIDNGRNDYRQEIQVSFDRPITDLAFTITDIDTQSAQAGTTWSDRVELSPNVTSYSAPTGSEVIGRGRNENINNDDGRGPFRRTADFNVDNTGDNSGNIDVTYASRAANSAFTLTFWTNTAAGNQRIFLSDFTFTANTCI